MIDNPQLNQIKSGIEAKSNLLSAEKKSQSDPKLSEIEQSFTQKITATESTRVSLKEQYENEKNALKKKHTEHLEAFAGSGASDGVLQAGVAEKIESNQAEVAMVPGSAFGSPGCMRISFATSMDNIEMGMERVINSVKR